MSVRQSDTSRLSPLRPKRCICHFKTSRLVKPACSPEFLPILCRAADDSLKLLFEGIRVGAAMASCKVCTRNPKPYARYPSPCTCAFARNQTSWSRGAGSVVYLKWSHSLDPFYNVCLQPLPVFHLELMRAVAPTEHSRRCGQRTNS